MAKDSGEELVRTLRRLYEGAERELRQILGSVDSTDFMRGRASLLLPQIESVLRRLKAAHRQWALNAAADAYLDAAETILGREFRFNLVDLRAVDAVASAMVTDLDRALDSIPRELTRIFLQTQQEAVGDRALLEQVGRARVLGLTREDLARRIAQTMRDGATERLRGLLPRDVAERLRAIADGKYVPIIGKDGVLRRYDPKWYAEVVGRTWSMTAANQAALRMAEEFETDLVRFPVHSGACPICLPFQGRIFSISGQSQDFPPITVVGQLPKHPQCRHRWSPVNADTLRARGQYDRLVEFSRSDRIVEDIFQYRQVVAA